MSKRNGDTWNFGEDLIVLYDQQVDDNASTMVCTADPALPGAQPPQAVYQMEETRFSVDIMMSHRTPGVQYKINCSGIVFNGGASAPFPTITVNTPPAPVPEAPVLSVKNDSRAGFFYGTLGGYVFDDAWFAKAQATGIQFIRHGAYPSDIAVSRTAYDHTSEEGVIQGMLDHGMQPLYAIITGYAPVWAQGSNPGGRCGGDETTFATPALYQEYVTTEIAWLHARFPTLRHFEIGTNEPNSNYNWCNTTPEFAPYADKVGIGMSSYLKVAYAAIHKEIPNAVVEAPNLYPTVSGGWDIFTYLNNLETNGCKTGVCWDVFSLHIYDYRNPHFSDPTVGPDPLYGNYPNIEFVDGNNALGPVYATVKHVQAVVCKQHNDCNMPIAITETGAYTSLSDSTGAYGLDPAVQAAYMSYLFNWALRDPTIRYIIWSELFNSGFGDPYDSIGVYFDDGSHKPSFDVLHRFATY